MEPKATPIASPSGILWIVIELINKIILFFLLDSEVLTKTLSKTLSLKYKRRPPIKNPIVVTS